ncbi:hypothetical protein ABPG75_009576 [Micractinium tetrahymenae]
MGNRAALLLLALCLMASAGAGALPPNRRLLRAAAGDPPPSQQQAGIDSLDLQEALHAVNQTSRGGPWRQRRNDVVTLQSSEDAPTRIQQFTAGLRKFILGYFWWGVASILLMFALSILSCIIGCVVQCVGACQGGECCLCCDCWDGECCAPLRCCCRCRRGEHRVTPCSSAGDADGSPQAGPGSGLLFQLPSELELKASMSLSACCECSEAPAGAAAPAAAASGADAWAWRPVLQLMEGQRPPPRSLSDALEAAGQQAGRP